VDIFNKYSTDFINKVIDDANALIIYVNPAGDISFCNKKVEDIVAAKKSEITGNNWLNLLYKNDNAPTKQQMFKAIMDDSIKYRRPNNFEGLITDRQNKEHLIFWSITPIISAANELDGILLIGNDITESKEREESLKKIDETLKNIFSSIKEYALYVVNLDGNITYFGMGSEMMFGWPKNDIIFKHVSLLHSQDDAINKLPIILEQVRNFGQYETEIGLIKKDGTTFPVILTANKFLDTEGALIGYIFIAKDITERKKLERQIIQSEKLAAIGQLAAGMAHEINNPLFVISGRLEMTLEQKRLAQNVRQTLTTIKEQAERIRKLVDQLLKFSRSAPPRFVTLNINEVIESVMPLLAFHKLPEAKIEITKDLARDILPIKGDLNQLQEVFVNLCLNAYQAMPQGGRLNIKTSNLQNQYAQVQICDTGCGIKEENLKNIFMPFFSTKKEGTGLGLSICYNIIKNHHGTMEVTSQKGCGTVFFIKLPFA
jgi:PAS domain S-box-containing protein